jgi:hypothetical protein
LKSATRANELDPAGAPSAPSLTETDSAKREALLDEARADWTGIGALGLVRDYLDFKMELKP